MSIKERKIIKILQEFEVTGNVYELGNISLENVIFMAREPNKTFVEIPRNYYTITTSGEQNKTIEVNFGFLTPMVRMQVCKVIILKTQTYETELPNLNNLKTYYNTLASEFLEITEVMRKHYALSDTREQALLLPELNPRQMWITDDEGKLIAIDFKELSVIISNEMFDNQLIGPNGGTMVQKWEFTVEVEDV